MRNRTADGGTVGQFSVGSVGGPVPVVGLGEGDPVSEAGPSEGWLRLIFRQTDNQSTLRRRHALLVALLGEIRLA